MNVTRLRKMSANEIAHRLREHFRQNADLVHFRAGVHLEDRELDDLIARHGSSLKGYMHHAVLRRFYPSTQDSEGTAEFIAKHFPGWFDHTIQEAETLREHRVRLLGYGEIALGTHIDWHRDPVSGYQWPRQFWSEFDLVNKPPADAKVVHELNRHQHLPRLAKAFVLTHDERYAREAVSQIESWIEQNPVWNGINWQSSLEIGIRTISWLWTIFLLLPSQALDEATLRRIVRSLLAQLDHVYRYPSVYSSPNTHLIGEAAALFIAGVVFREIPRASQWREFGEKTLIQEMQNQVLRDGVYCELSSYYHCYATDFYLHVLSLARWNRLAFPEWMWERLSQMLEFVMQISRLTARSPCLAMMTAAVF